jgi:hypothetical protein
MNCPRWEVCPHCGLEYEPGGHDPERCAWQQAELYLIAAGKLPVIWECRVAY